MVWLSLTDVMELNYALFFKTQCLFLEVMTQELTTLYITAQKQYVSAVRSGLSRTLSPTKRA